MGLETGTPTLQLAHYVMLVAFNHYYTHRILTPLTFTYYFNKNTSAGIFGGDSFFKWSSPAC